MKDGKQFSFYGKTLSYEKDQVEYNRIRYHFESFAKENVSKLFDEYDSFGDLDTFYEKYVDWIRPYLYKSCDIAIEELGKLKHYGIERDEYFEDVFDASAVAEALEPIDKYYEELAEKKEERSAAHSRRFHAGTHLRDSYYDGGDAALSVTANIGGGIAAAGFNAVASGINFLVDCTDKAEIYNKSRDVVVSAIVNSIGSAYFELIEYARKECKGFTVKNIPGKNIKEANAICKNLVAGKIGRNDVFDCAEKVLNLYPYNESFYEYIMINFGDEKRELQEIADFFHIDGLDKLQTKLIHEYYKSLNITTENEAVSARAQIEKQAAKLGVADYSCFLPLERLIVDFDLQYRTVCGIVFSTREQAELNKELHKYYQSLDFNSTKTNALAAIEALEKKAKDLKVSANWLKPYIDAALAEIQKNAWLELDRFYATLDLADEQKALAARNVIANKAKELEIDDFKTYPPLEGVIVQFDELAHTAFEYRFETRDDAQRASTDENVFFKTVWTCIAEVGRQTSAVKRWDDISADKQKVICETLSLKDQPFVFVDTTLLKSGKNGLAITPSGIYWNNGSALLQDVANNVVFKTLFKKKAQEMLDKHSVSVFSVPWKEFFNSDTGFCTDEKKMITITADKMFEATNAKAENICAMLEKIHCWGKMVKFEFTDTPHPVPEKSCLLAAPALTEIPESVTIQIPKVEVPFPDNTVLLQQIAKYRGKECGLMIAPEIAEDRYNNFLGQLNVDLREKAMRETPVCQADHTMFSNGKKGFLLTNNALYYHDANEFMVELSDIVNIDSCGSVLEIGCADFEDYYLKGDGVETLAEVLSSLIKK